MNSSRRPMLGDFDPNETPVALKQTKPSAYYLEATETFPGLGNFQKAERRGFQICFATTWSSFKSTSSPASSARWITLHGKETNSRLKQIRPANLTAFFDMSTNQPAVDIGHRLANVLPPNCYKYGCNYIVRGTA